MSRSLIEAPERFSGNSLVISSLMEFKYLVLIRDSFPTGAVGSGGVVLDAVPVGRDVVVVVVVVVVPSSTPFHTTYLLASYLAIVSQGKFFDDPALRIC